VLITLIAAMEATIRIVGNVPLIDDGRLDLTLDGDLMPSGEELRRL
jgi:hypothetical protein